MTISQLLPAPRPLVRSSRQDLGDLSSRRLAAARRARLRRLTAPRTAGPRCRLTRVVAGPLGGIADLPSVTSTPAAGSGPARPSASGWC